MPRKQDQDGTGGRGSLSTLEDLGVEDFDVVPEDEELTRSNLGPSKYKPLIDKARQNQPRKIRLSDPIQATDPETGEPIFETDESGNVVQDGDGNPVPVWERREDGSLVKRPRLYKKTDAEEFVKELRNAGNREKLSQRRLSLRIVAKTPDGVSLAKASESDEVEVQFYVIGLTPNVTPQPQS
jgi:hypothetical protein